jgi:hypothetical protein
VTVDGNATPWLFYPMQRPGIPGLGGWVDTEASLDGCEKFRPQFAVETRTVQPSLYSDYAIPAHDILELYGEF